MKLLTVLNMLASSEVFFFNCWHQEITIRVDSLRTGVYKMIKLQVGKTSTIKKAKKNDAITMSANHTNGI